MKRFLTLLLVLLCSASFAGDLDLGSGALFPNPNLLVLAGKGTTTSPASNTWLAVDGLTEEYDKTGTEWDGSATFTSSIAQTIWVRYTDTYADVGFYLVQPMLNGAATQYWGRSFCTNIYGLGGTSPSYSWVFKLAAGNTVSFARRIDSSSAPSVYSTRLEIYRIK